MDRVHSRFDSCKLVACEWCSYFTITPSRLTELDPPTTKQPRCWACEPSLLFKFKLLAPCRSNLEFDSCAGSYSLYFMPALCLVLAHEISISQKIEGIRFLVSRRQDLPRYATSLSMGAMLHQEMLDELVQLTMMQTSATHVNLRQQTTLCSRRHSHGHRVGLPYRENIPRLVVV